MKKWIFKFFHSTLCDVCLDMQRNKDYKTYYASARVQVWTISMYFFTISNNFLTLLPSSTSTQLNSIQLKLRLRWSIFPLNPATHPPTTRNSLNSRFVSLSKLNLNSTQFNSNWGWDGIYFHLIQPPTHPPPTRNSLNCQFVSFSNTFLGICLGYWIKCLMFDVFEVIEELIKSLWILWSI